MLILLELPTEEMDSLLDLRLDLPSQSLPTMQTLVQVSSTLKVQPPFNTLLAHSSSNTLLLHNFNTLLLHNFNTLPLHSSNTTNQLSLSPKRSDMLITKSPSNMPDMLMSQ
jgi:hypothetical protein